MKLFTVLALVLLATQVQAATLIVSSTPSGAEVLLDKESVGHTPFRKWVSPGNYALVLKKDNCKELSQRIEVGRKMVILRLKLEPKTYPVDILFKSMREDTMDWHVFANDGTHLGTAPGTFEFPKGKQSILLVKDGFKDIPLIFEVTGVSQMLEVDDPQKGRSSAPTRKVSYSGITTTTVIDCRKYRATQYNSLVENLVLHKLGAWSIVGGELRGKPSNSNNYNYAMLRTKFKSITAVHIRGRLMPGSEINFRVSVGPLNMCLNWRSGGGKGPVKECQYRDGVKTVHVPGYIMDPGRVADILITQRGKEYIVYIDRREVFRTAIEKLSGTVQVYPTWDGEIGVSLIEVQGVTDSVPATSPSHRLW